MSYLVEVKNNIISKLYRRFIDNNGKIYMEARTKDQRLKGPISIAKLVFRISISQLAFYITVTSFIINPLIRQFRDQIVFLQNYRDLVETGISLALSVGILALYLPM